MSENRYQDTSDLVAQITAYAGKALHIEPASEMGGVLQVILAYEFGMTMDRLQTFCGPLSMAKAKAAKGMSDEDFSKLMGKSA